MPIKYKTGKKPARPGAIKHKFADFFDASELPTPPMVFGKTSLIHDFGMDLNDELSCCVVSGAHHESMLWNALGGRMIPLFKRAQTVADYSAISGYVPGDDSTDGGCDMVEAAKYRQRTGMLDAAGTRHYVDAFVSLEPGNIAQITLAAFLFGAVGVGVNLAKNSESQFDAQQPWTLTAKAGNEGGHYVPIVGRNHLGMLLCVTWGRLQAIDPAWLAERNDEGVAYLSFESLRANDNLSQRGYDKAGLQAVFGKF